MFRTFKSLSPRQRLRYIWDYFKLPIAILCILLYIAGYRFYKKATRREIELYAAAVNVTMGEDLTASLTDGFLRASNLDPKETELQWYSGLYLTDDSDSLYHQYTYASRLKILGVINAVSLDVVFMNREAFDAFSQNGYLCDLSSLLAEDEALSGLLREALVENTVVLEDNAAEAALDSSLSYEAVTESRLCGLSLDASPLIREAGFKDTVYLGVIENSPRKDRALLYIRYLFGKDCISTALPAAP